MNTQEVNDLKMFIVTQIAAVGLGIVVGELICQWLGWL